MLNALKKMNLLLSKIGTKIYDCNCERGQNLESPEEVLSQESGDIIKAVNRP